MSVVECAVQEVAQNHVVVLYRTEDGEVGAFEMTEEQEQVTLMQDPAFVSQLPLTQAQQQQLLLAMQQQQQQVPSQAALHGGAPKAAKTSSSSSDAGVQRWRPLAQMNAFAAAARGRENQLKWERQKCAALKQASEAALSCLESEAKTFEKVHDEEVDMLKRQVNELRTTRAEDLAKRRADELALERRQREERELARQQAEQIARRHSEDLARKHAEELERNRQLAEAAERKVREQALMQAQAEQMAKEYEERRCLEKAEDKEERELCVEEKVDAFATRKRENHLPKSLEKLHDLHLHKLPIYDQEGGHKIHAWMPKKPTLSGELSEQQFQQPLRMPLPRSVSAAPAYSSASSVAATAGSSDVVSTSSSRSSSQARDHGSVNWQRVMKPGKTPAAITHEVRRGVESNPAVAGDVNAFVSYCLVEVFGVDQQR